MVFFAAPVNRSSSLILPEFLRLSGIDKCSRRFDLADINCHVSLISQQKRIALLAHRYLVDLVHHRLGPQIRLRVHVGLGRNVT